MTPLDEERCAGSRTLIERGYEAVAIAYLFSHQNPAHERRTADAAQARRRVLRVGRPTIAPVMGEYERSATALFNAYVGPVIDSYLAGSRTRWPMRA